MSTCLICSDGDRGGAARRRRILTPLLALLVFAATPAGAQNLLTQDEALRLAFPSASRVERRTAFLDDAQLEAAQRAAGRDAPIAQPVVTYYVGMAGGRALGAAYFDAHRVRTMQEVVMIVVSPRATVDRIEILSFAEPPEYRAPPGWLDQFDGEPLGAELTLRGAIRNLSGATLTSRAITAAARRALALHGVIDPFGAPAGREGQ